LLICGGHTNRLSGITEKNRKMQIKTVLTGELENRATKM
jgi:hypothetical protein